MHIIIVAVGKVREPFIKAGIETYAARITSCHRLTFIELPEEKVPGRMSRGEKEAILQSAWDRFPGTGPRPSVAIALDPGGVLLPSEEFAARLKGYEVEGKGSVAFLIGGPLGLPDAVRGQADLVLSLSRLTFPHQLVRLILIEQIYRAACINRNIPYHK